MRLLLKYTFIIVFWLTAVTVNAELTNNLFNIRHIGYSEGLSSQRVFSIVEDQHSVIWVATKIGIDRYNGQVVKSYTLPGDLYYGEKAGRRLRLLYDQGFGLWAYDHIGRIFHYSTENDAFELKLSLGQIIGGEIILNKIFIDSNGSIWMGLSKGLYKKEKEGNVVAILPDQYVNDIVAGSESVFVGTSKGVVQLFPIQEPTW